VVVTMGGRLFAIDANSFRGVLSSEEAAGRVVSADGTIYPALALRDFLEVSPSEDSLDRRVLLLAHQDRYGSIGVDRVHGQVACQASEIVPLPLHFQGAEREWYQGMIVFQESVAMILNISWVLSGAPLDHDAGQPEWSTDSVHGCAAHSAGGMARVQKC
jgi:chemotaxis signal transduction protein